MHVLFATLYSVISYSFIAAFICSLRYRHLQPSKKILWIKTWNTSETLHGCAYDLLTAHALYQISQHWSRTSLCRPNPAIWKIMTLTSDQQLMWSQMRITVPLPEEERTLTGWHEGLLRPDVCSAQSDTCSGMQMTRSAHEDVYLASCGWEICCLSETMWATCGSLPEVALWNILRKCLNYQIRPESACWSRCWFDGGLVGLPTQPYYSPANVTYEAGWPALSLCWRW